MTTSDAFQRLSAAVTSGDDEAAGPLTAAALAAGALPAAVLAEALLPAMEAVGVRFRQHEIFLPDVLLAARAMARAMDVLRPLLEGQDLPSRGRVVLGTVAGDVHDIGKNLVATLLRGAGFEVLDLGTDVAPERFVATAEESGAAVIGLSALLTTTMAGMHQVVDLIRARGLAVKVVVGGAPVTPAFAAEIGADAYGFDAADAVERVRELVGAR